MKSNAPISARPDPRPREPRWFGWVTAGALGTLAAATVTYVVYGLPNADEGWYLYAARLVYQGQLPYRDFAFTQSPFMPYVYGLPQLLFGPSLLVGRITSAVLWLITVVLAVGVARRLGGRFGAMFCAVLFAVYMFGTFNFVVVKTYSLMALLLVATFYVLASDLPDGVRFPLASLLACALALTRISGAPFAAVVVLWCVLHAPTTRIRAGVLAIAAIAIATMDYFVAGSVSAAKWNLVDYHQLTVGGQDVFDRIDDAVRHRIPEAARFYLAHILLVSTVVLAAIAWPALRGWRRRSEVRAVALGLLLFEAGHLIAGEWHTDYLVAGVPCAVALVSSVAGRIVAKERLALRVSGEDAVVAASHGAARKLLASLLIGAAILIPITTDYFPQLDWEGGPPLTRLHDVADFVASHTSRSDLVLALESQAVLIDADRSDVPGVSLAQFSYVDVPDKKADHLHVVNNNILSEYVEERVPAAVVVSGFDLGLFARRGTLSTKKADYTRFLRALNANYRPAYRKKRIGQGAATVTVWLLR